LYCVRLKLLDVVSSHAANSIVAGPPSLSAKHDARQIQRVIEPASTLRTMAYSGNEIGLQADIICPPET
jgi:hypothetical protein